MSKAAIDIRDLSVSYGQKCVVPSVSFAVKNAHIFGLMGLNGAGKTTIIKAILGLRDYDSGSIQILGDHYLSRLSKSRIAYLPEKFEPPAFLKGYEFLNFALSLYGVKMTRSKMDEAANALALDKAALGMRVNTYSKGMRQKLGLLGTLLSGAQILILDEPMSGLDPRARACVKAMILDLKAQGKTIFLSSHILADMDEVCDDVAVLHEGGLRFYGAPHDLKKQTRTTSLEHAFLNCIDQNCVA